RLVEKESVEISSKGPKRYAKGGDLWGKKKGALPTPTPPVVEGEDGEGADYVEQRFGRNLSVELADAAKLAIRRRIAGSLAEVGGMGNEEVKGLPAEGETVRNVKGFGEDDV